MTISAPFSAGGLKSNNTAKLIKGATKSKYDYNSIPDRVTKGEYSALQFS